MFSKSILSLFGISTTCVGLFVYWMYSRPAKKMRLEQSPKTYKISELNIYPIKSCGPIKIEDSWPLDEYGLKYDRNWVIVERYSTKSDSDLFRTVGPKQAKKVHAIHPLISPDGTLTLTAKGFPDFKVPNISNVEKSIKKFKVIHDSTKGVDLGEEVGKWLDQVLSNETSIPKNLPRTFYLLTLEKNHHRGLDPYFTDKIQNQNTQTTPNLEVGFANGFPFLITTESSLNALVPMIHEKNSKISVTMKRFRPNIVVQGTEPWEEDRWRELEVLEKETENPKMIVHCVRPCPRCMHVTYDPETHVSNYTVLKVLNEKRPMVVKGRKGGIFGHQALYQKLEDNNNNSLSLSVGDLIRVKKTTSSIDDS